MARFFDIQTVFFTVLGYPMSYVEFFGTVFNLWAVWLVAKNKILNWPVGIAGVSLFAFLFYQIRLYSDFVEQIYFFVMSLYGWWRWLHPKTSEETGEDLELKTTINTRRQNLHGSVVIGAGTLALGYLASRIHLNVPRFFPEPAAFPYLDAFTTVMSFAAMILQARRKVESWVLWILVDIVGVALYAAKGVRFVALLYFAFLIMAIRGYRNWRGEYRAHQAGAAAAAPGLS